MRDALVARVPEPPRREQAAGLCREWSENDLVALEAFLARQGVAEGPLTTGRICEGHSNLTYLVSGRRSVIVRRPPPPPVPLGRSGISRELAGACEPLTSAAQLGAVALEPGYPTHAELVERYAARTGRELSGFRWYATMALWELACSTSSSHRGTVAGHGEPYGAALSLASLLDTAFRTAGLSA